MDLSSTNEVIKVPGEVMLRFAEDDELDDAVGGAESLEETPVAPATETYNVIYGAGMSQEQRYTTFGQQSEQDRPSSRIDSVSEDLNQVQQIISEFSLANNQGTGPQAEDLLPYQNSQMEEDQFEIQERDQPKVISQAEDDGEGFSQQSDSGFRLVEESKQAQEAPKLPENEEIGPENVDMTETQGMNPCDQHLSQPIMTDTKHISGGSSENLCQNPSSSGPSQSHKQLNARLRSGDQTSANPMEKRSSASSQQMILFNGPQCEQWRQQKQRETAERRRQQIEEWQQKQQKMINFIQQPSTDNYNTKTLESNEFSAQPKHDGEDFLRGPELEFAEVGNAIESVDHGVGLAQEEFLIGGAGEMRGEDLVEEAQQLRAVLAPGAHLVELDRSDGVGQDGKISRDIEPKLVDVRCARPDHGTIKRQIVKPSAPKGPGGGFTGGDPDEEVMQARARSPIQKSSRPNTNKHSPELADPSATRFAEEFGAGATKGLEKLNALMNQSSLKRNELKKLYEYVSGIEQYKQATSIDNINKIIPDYPKPEILDIFIREFRPFQEMPESCSKQIFAACVPMSFELQERILKINPAEPQEKAATAARNPGSGLASDDLHHTPSSEIIEDETGMYMICNGEVIVIKSQTMYEKFNQNEDTLAKDNQFKSQINENVQFGSVAKIGWAITSYLMNTPQFRQIIDQKIEILKRDALMKTFAKNDAAQLDCTLGKGEMFGDFGLFKERKFEQIYAISMHPDTKILYLSKEKLRKILDVDPENFQVLTSRIPEMSSNSQIIQRQICRHFEEVEFYPGQKILTQGDTPEFVYLIKEGACILSQTIPVSELVPKKVECCPSKTLQKFSAPAKTGNDSNHQAGKPTSTNATDTPNQAKSDEKDPTKVHYLDLTLMEITQNEWIGEDFILKDKGPARAATVPLGRVLQNITAKTYLKCLKISCSDFRKKIPQGYRTQLKRITEDKQIYLKDRLEQVKTAYNDSKNNQTQLKIAYQSKSPAIRRLHPYASKQLVDSIGFGDGKMFKKHHARCADSIRVGEIAIKSDEELYSKNNQLSNIMYKQFRPKDIKRVENFEVDLQEQRSRQSNFNRKPGETSYVQREVEVLQKILWEDEYNLQQQERTNRQYAAAKGSKKENTANSTPVEDCQVQPYQSEKVLTHKEKIQMLVKGLVKDSRPKRDEGCSSNVSPSDNKAKASLIPDPSEAKNENSRSNSKQPSNAKIYKKEYMDQRPPDQAPAASPRSQRTVKRHPDSQGCTNLKNKHLENLQKAIELPIASLIQSTKPYKGNQSKLSLTNSPYSKDRSNHRSTESWLFGDGAAEVRSGNLGSLGLKPSLKVDDGKTQTMAAPPNDQSTGTTSKRNDKIKGGLQKAFQGLNFLKFREKLQQSRNASCSMSSGYHTEESKTPLTTKMTQAPFRFDVNIINMKNGQEINQKDQGVKPSQMQIGEVVRRPQPDAQAETSRTEQTQENNSNQEQQDHYHNGDQMQQQLQTSLCISIQSGTTPSPPKRISVNHTQIPASPRRGDSRSAVALASPVGQSKCQKQADNTNDYRNQTATHSLIHQRNSISPQSMYHNTQNGKQELNYNQVAAHKKTNMTDGQTQDSEKKSLNDQTPSILPQIENVEVESDLSSDEIEMRQMDAFLGRDLNQEQARLEQHKRRQYQKYLNRFCSKPVSAVFGGTMHTFFKEAQKQSKLAMNKARKEQMQTQSKFGFDESFDPLKTNNRFQTRVAKVRQSAQRYAENIAGTAVQGSPDYSGHKMRNSVDVRATSSSKRRFSMTTSSLFKELDKDLSAVCGLKAHPKRKLIIQGDVKPEIIQISNKQEQKVLPKNNMKYISVTDFTQELPDQLLAQQLSRRSEHGKSDSGETLSTGKLGNSGQVLSGPKIVGMKHDGATRPQTYDYQIGGQSDCQSTSRKKRMPYQTQILINKISNLRSNQRQIASVDPFNGANGQCPLINIDRNSGSVSTHRIASLVHTLNKAAQRDRKDLQLPEFQGQKNRKTGSQTSSTQAPVLQVVRKFNQSQITYSTGVIRKNQALTESTQTLRSKINSINTSSKPSNLQNDLRFSNDSSSPRNQRSTHSNRSREDPRKLHQYSVNDNYETFEGMNLQVNTDYGHYTQELKKMRQKRTFRNFNHTAYVGGKSFKE